MNTETKKFLSDIYQAIILIDEFTKDAYAFSDYHTDHKTRSAVERQLGIIGEAMNKLLKSNPEIKITSSSQIISFRNILIHSYDGIDDAIVWTILENHLSTLKKEVAAYLT